MKLKNNHQYGKEEILRKIHQGSFVAVEYESTVDLLDDHLFCNLQILEEKIPLLYVEACF